MNTHLMDPDNEVQHNSQLSVLMQSSGCRSQLVINHRDGMNTHLMDPDNEVQHNSQLSVLMQSSGCRSQLVTASILLIYRFIIALVFCIIYTSLFTINSSINNKK